MSKKLSGEDYTVGWLCLLEVVHSAAVTMLDEQHDSSVLGVPADIDALFSLGNIAKSNIAIVGLSDTSGNRVSAAAKAVSWMKSTFPNLTSCLLVGVGGGVPTNADAGVVRLGDVVVSQPTNEHPGGAVRHDLAKAKDGLFEFTGGAVAAPPAILIKAAQDLVTKRAGSPQDPIKESLKRLDISGEEYRRYRYPGADLDHLYRADGVHRQSGVCQSGVCRDEATCGPLYSTTPGLHCVHDDDPSVVIHRGPRVSGELVIEDGVLRDKLAGKGDLLCFETDITDVLADFHCLVIYGISRYCDSHNHDSHNGDSHNDDNGWQGYAAAVAVSCARELCAVLPGNESRSTSATAEDNTGSENSKQKLGGDNDYYPQMDILLEWLAPADQEPRQADYSRRRYPGSCRLFLDSEEYQAWVRSEQQKTLFCRGPPGAGKTILASAVIQDLKRRFRPGSNVGVAYIYCDFRLREEQPCAEDLLLKLFRQLLQTRSKLPEKLKALFTRVHGRALGERPWMDEASGVLEELITTYSRVFIVVDALDEYRCRHRTTFLSSIFKLQAKHPVNFLATSTSDSDPEIAELFDNALALEIRANEHDVRRYLARHMDQLSSFVKIQPDLQEDIKANIIRAACGRFLLADLQLQSLVGKKSPEALRNALADLATGSAGYDQAYDSAMERIDGQLPEQAALAHRVLGYIISARRPLSASELQHALAVKVGDVEIDNDSLPHIQNIIHACAGLVTSDSERENGTIRLIHRTAHDYLELKRQQRFPEAEKDIATACVAYLSLQTIQSGFCRTDAELEQRRRSYPLFDYAARHWGHHARVAPPAFRDPESMDFLSSQPHIESSCQLLWTANQFIHFMYYPYCKYFPKRLRALHLVAYFGIENLAPRLLASKPGINARDSDGWTPLAWAAHEGHERVVELLLRQPSVDIDGRANNGRTSISLGAENGHAEVVRLLLNHGANPHFRDLMSATPLWYAVVGGHAAVVQLLVERDVELNFLIYHGELKQYTPLALAAKRGYEKVVQVLLNQKSIKPHATADIEHTQKTPLQLAVENGHRKVVELLLAKPGDVNDDEIHGSLLGAAIDRGDEEVVKLLLTIDGVVKLSCDRGKFLMVSWLRSVRPLSYAIEKGHEGIVKLLLDQINTQMDETDGSEELLQAASAAAWWGRVGILKLLIEKGVNANALLPGGGTILSQAAMSDQELVVELLLATKGVDADPRDDEGQTPLALATASRWRTGREKDHTDVVKRLLNSGRVDPDSQNAEGRTPLSYAAEDKRLVIFTMLLERDDVDPGKKDANGWSPLFWAVKGKHEAAVELLLQKGVDPNPKSTRSDSAGETPLLLAAANGNLPIVQSLLSRDGIDLEPRDSTGCTPLYRAAEKGHGPVVEALLAGDDINPNSRNEDGWTPLLVAAEQGHDMVVKALLTAARLEADSKDSTGRTALSLAAEHGRLSVVEQLLAAGGVNPDSKDNKRRTPLSWAVAPRDQKRSGTDNQQVVKRLLRVDNVNPNAEDEMGWTPLLWAVQSYNGSAMVEILLEHERVDVNHEDKEGRTPLSLATESGSEVIGDQLRASGAKLGTWSRIQEVGKEDKKRVEAPFPEDNNDKEICENEADKRDGAVWRLFASEELGDHTDDGPGAQFQLSANWLGSSEAVDGYDHAEWRQFPWGKPEDSAGDGLGTALQADLFGKPGDYTGDDLGTALQADLFENFEGFDKHEGVVDWQLFTGGELENNTGGDDGLGTQFQTNLFESLDGFGENGGAEWRLFAEEELENHTGDDDGGLGAQQLLPKTNWFGSSNQVDEHGSLQWQPFFGEELGDHGGDGLGAQLQLQANRAKNIEEERRRRESEDRKATQRKWAEERELKEAWAKDVRIELGVQETNAAGDSEMCEICGSIDFTAVFSRRPPERRPVSVITLGKVDESWELRPCAMCRLIAAVRPRTLDNTEGLSYDLRAYSSTASWLARSSLEALRHFQSDWVDTVFLGIQPVAPYRLIGLGKPNFLRAGFISRVGSNDRNRLRSVTVHKLFPDKIDFARARGWIQRCLENHPEQCGGPHSFRPVPHLRLIDCTTRDIIVPSSTVQFVALSYVWGSPPPDAPDARAHCHVDKSDLVVKDAIRVTLELGYSYLWVDRHCITQEDEKVRQEQLQNMNAVYESAEVTIIACGGSNSAFGLPGVSSRDRIAQVHAQVKGHLLTSIPLVPSFDILDSVWSTRGWTYQEGALSRRRLLFTEREISFECGEMVCREAIELPARIHKIATTSSTELCTRAFPRGGSVGGGNDTLADFWNRVGDYTKRRLTYEHDILNAMLGVMQAFTDLKISVQHLCGIPIPIDGNCQGNTETHSPLETFVSGLCWTPKEPGTRREGFPSWSWAGWKVVVSKGPEYGIAFKDGFPIDVSIVLADGLRMAWADFEALDKAGRSSLLQSYLLEITAAVVEVTFWHDDDRRGDVWEVAINSGDDVLSGWLTLSKDPSEDDEFRRRLAEERWPAVVMGNASSGRASLLLVDQLEGHWERMGLIMTYTGRLLKGELERRTLLLG